MLDVSVCLLLVSPATVALAGAPVDGPDPASGRAEEVATTLAGSTTAVEYSSGGQTRTVRGTYAGLMADAARAALANRSSGFRRAVAARTRPVLTGDGWQARVVAVWRPYPGGRAGSVAVGPARLVVRTWSP